MRCCTCISRINARLHPPPRVMTVRWTQTRRENLSLVSIRRHVRLILRYFCFNDLVHRTRNVYASWWTCHRVGQTRCERNLDWGVERTETFDANRHGSCQVLYVMFWLSARILITSSNITVSNIVLRTGTSLAAASFNFRRLSSQRASASHSCTSSDLESSKRGGRFETSGGRTDHCEWIFGT